MSLKDENERRFQRMKKIVNGEVNMREKIAEIMTDCIVDEYNPNGYRKKGILRYADKILALFPMDAKVECPECNKHKCNCLTATGDHLSMCQATKCICKGTSSITLKQLMEGE